MNEELQNFIVKFTTEGFADLKTSLNETNKMLEDIDKGFSKSTKSGDNFFGALVKWTGLVGGLTAAFVVLKNTIRGVFDTATDVVDLYQQEQLLGVEARVLEKYGLVAQRNMGSQADAYTFFNDVNELMGKFQSGKITSDDMYKFTKLGIGFQYKRDSSISPDQELAQNRDAYLRALHTAVSHINLNDADKMGIMKDLIKPKSLQTLFMANDEQFEKQMAWGDKWRVLSKNENDLQSAQDLLTVEMEWKQTVKKFSIEIMPIFSKVLMALEPLMPVIEGWIKQMGDWVDENADNIAGWIEQGVNWLIDELPKILTDLGTVLGSIATFVGWIVDNLGGTSKGLWAGGKAIWAQITGAPDADKQWNEFSGNLQSGKYGIMSDLYDWFDTKVFPTGETRLPPSNNVTNNNGATYNIKAGTTFDKDTVLGPTGPMMAHTASSIH